MRENFPGLVSHLPMIQSLLEWLIDPCIDFTKKHCRELTPTAPINLAKSVLNMYESMLDEFRIAPGTRASQRASRIGGIVLFTPPTGDDINIWVQCLFVMSVVWAAGATIDSEGRQKFNLFFRRLNVNSNVIIACVMDDLLEAVNLNAQEVVLITSLSYFRKLQGIGIRISALTWNIMTWFQKNVFLFCRVLALDDNLGFELPAGQVIKKPGFKMALPYPEPGSVYNYCFWKIEQVWKEWILTVDTRPPAMDAAYNDIVVPTVDTARYSFLLMVLVMHQRHVLFCGPTGTGKVLIVYEIKTKTDIFESVAFRLVTTVSRLLLTHTFVVG